MADLKPRSTSYSDSYTNWHEARDRVPQESPPPRSEPGWRGSPPDCVNVEPRRLRQTKPERPSFNDVLAKSAAFVFDGAKVVTSVVAGPVLAAAVPGAAVGEAAQAVGAAVSGGPGSELATMQAMQRESQMFNLQLLELQEQVQQENRRFSTLSNVLRAKHDTAKAAVSNIRG